MLRSEDLWPCSAPTPPRIRRTDDNRKARSVLLPPAMRQLEIGLQGVVQVPVLAALAVDKREGLFPERHSELAKFLALWPIA